MGQQNTAQESFRRGEINQQNAQAAAIQGFGSWSAVDYRNGSDIQSDNYVADRARADALYGLGSNGPVRLGEPSGMGVAEWSGGVNRAISRSAAEQSAIEQRLADLAPPSYGSQPGILVADASDVMDKMGQPLNGRSNYNVVSKFREIVGGIPQRSLGSTLSQLTDWATYTVPDAQQRAAEITGRYAPDPRFSVLDRALASPLGGAAYGLANLSGASPATQELLLGLGSVADGLLMSAAAVKGAVPSFLGAQRPGVMDVESPYALTSNNYLSGIARSDKLGMGIRFEANQGLLDSYSLYGGRTASQLYVRAFDANGNLLPGSVRLDQVGLRADGRYDLIDYKLSNRSPLTENQGLHYPALAQNGGLVTGLRGRDINLPRGTYLPPATVNIQPGPTLSNRAGR